MENWQKEKLIDEYPPTSDKIFLIMEYLWQGSSFDKKNTDQQEKILKNIMNLLI